MTLMSGCVYKWKIAHCQRQHSGNIQTWTVPKISTQLELYNLGFALLIASSNPSPVWRRALWACRKTSINLDHMQHKTLKNSQSRKPTLQSRTTPTIMTWDLSGSLCQKEMNTGGNCAKKSHEHTARGFRIREALARKKGMKEERQQADWCIQNWGANSHTWHDDGNGPAEFWIWEVIIRSRDWWENTRKREIRCRDDLGAKKMNAEFWCSCRYQITSVTVLLRYRY
jgi:hypothetical protein